MAVMDQTYSIGNIIPIGQSDLTADDKDDARTAAPGQISIIVDAFGEKKFQYLRCRQNGGHAKGEAASLRTATSGGVSEEFTLSTGGGLASNRLYGKFNSAAKFKGWMCTHLNNVSTAGGAPEGEVAIVASNTASSIWFDSGRGFTTAPKVGDTVGLTSVHDVVDAAAEDKMHIAKGICVNGISVDRWGWYQQQGVVPYVKITNGANIVRNNIAVASAAHLRGSAASATSNVPAMQWGYWLATIQSDVKTSFAPAYIDVTGGLAGFGEQV
jgi:hypothetical protein